MTSCRKNRKKHHSPLNLQWALARKATVFSYVTFNHIVNYPNQVPPLLSFFVEYIYIDVFKNRGNYPKMDGENNGNPY